MASLVEMRRDMTWSVLAVFVMETTYTFGVVAASMLLGGMHRGWFGLGVLR
jgi:hypothetical protein